MDKPQKIKLLIGNEEACIKEYTKNGPDGLAQFLGMDRNGAMFKEIMLYFAFEKDVIFKCAIENMETIQQIFVAIGPSEMRKLMGIEDSAFDVCFESIFDIIGLGLRSFYKYTVSHKEELSAILFEKGPEALRAQLCIIGEKYDNLWEAVMDLILNEFTKKKFEERTLSHQEKFAKLMPKLQKYIRGIL